jgi:hypothetical protein
LTLATLQEFENVAEGLDLTVELKHKKINISNSRVCFILFIYPRDCFDLQIEFSWILKFIADAADVSGIVAGSLF